MADQTSENEFKDERSDRPPTKRQIKREGIIKHDVYDAKVNFCFIYFGPVCQLTSMYLCSFFLSQVFGEFVWAELAGLVDRALMQILFLIIIVAFCRGGPTKHYEGSQDHGKRHPCRDPFSRPRLRSRQYSYSSGMSSKHIHLKTELTWVGNYREARCRGLER